MARAGKPAGGASPFRDPWMRPVPRAARQGARVAARGHGPRPRSRVPARHDDALGYHALRWAHADSSMRGLRAAGAWSPTRPRMASLARVAMDEPMDARPRRPDRVGALGG